jgi:hypothetical protein
MYITRKPRVAFYTTLVFLSVALLAAFSTNPNPAFAGTRGTDMQATEYAEQNTAAAPAIDREAPTEFVTATFGLG